MDKKELNKIIGKNIQKARQERGFTQETFAELMDVSWSYVSKIEAGYLNLSVDKILDIANFLKIDVQILLSLRN